MSGPDRRLVSTRHGTVHVWTSGGGDETPLLLLHMSPRSGRMYHSVMQHTGRPVAAPDRLGFGFSDPPLRTPTMTGYAEATLDVVNALGWHRFDVIGTHTGSVEAIELTRLAADRVRHIGLVSVPAYTDEEITERLAGVAAPRPGTTRDGSHLTHLWRRRASIRSESVDVDFLQELFVDEVLSAPHAHLAYQAVLDYPTLDRLTRLDRPVVLFSPKDDLRRQTDRARAHLPAGSTVVDLPDLDFDLWAMAPETLARLITRFL